MKGLLAALPAADPLDSECVFTINPPLCLQPATSSAPLLLLHPPHPLSLHTNGHIYKSEHRLLPPLHPLSSIWQAVRTHCTCSQTHDNVHKKGSSPCPCWCWRDCPKSTQVTSDAYGRSKYTSGHSERNGAGLMTEKQQ